MPTATEPAFLAERRRKGAELATTLRLPNRTDEHYRRTSLEGLEPESYKAGPVTMTLKGDVPEGVIFTDMLTAAAQHPDLVAPYLGKLVSMATNKLTALQAANLAGGAFVYVPRGVAVSEPLQVVYEGAEGEAQYLHTVVVAGENASVTVIERYEGEGDYLSVGAVEVFALQGARVRYGYLQNHGLDAWAFLFRKGQPGRDATLEWVGGEFGGGVVRSELDTDVAGEGANSTIKLVYGATERQHMNIYASEVHAGNNSTSDILGRGVLSGRAHSVFWGNGQIKYGAKNCSTYQKQQALVLSEKARADSIPGLIIDENEVAGAGHAATVGKLDEEQLFYLMARGLSRREAINMLVMAFLAPVLDQIPVQEIKDELTGLMTEKVKG